MAVRVSAGARRRVVLPIAAIAVLLLLIPVSRAWVAFDHVRSDVRALTAIAPDRFLTAPQETDALFARTIDDYRQLRAAVGPFIFIAPAFSWVPVYGGDLASVRDLVEVADRAVIAAEGTLAVGRTFLADVDAGRARNEAISLTVTKSTQGQNAVIRSARDSLVKAVAARNRIDIVALSPSLVKIIDQFDRWVPLWRGGLDLLANTPTLLGMDRARQYLVIAQNSDELRPTGGLVSGVAVLRVEQGQITVGEFRNSSSIDDWSKSHPDPPEALSRYMYAGVWLFRDANWSPDLPVSARALMASYKLDQEVASDGVIGIGLGALPDVLAALGPLRVGSDSEPISAANAIATVKEYWSSPAGTPPTDDWSMRHKDYISLLFKESMTRVLAGEFDRGQMARALAQMAATKDLWVYVEGESGQSPVVFPPDVALHRGTGDALMVVDSNVGFNKVDASVGREIDYGLRVSANGQVRATTTITYTNRSPSTDSYCVHQTRYMGSYAALAEGCYWDYVRVVAPPGSTLLYATGVVAPLTEESEPGRTVFAGYFLLPRAEVHVVSFTYWLPFVIDRAATYTLHLEKQPGAPVIPAVVRFELPAGWHAKTRAAKSGLGNAVEIAVRLERNQVITVDLDRRGTWPLVAIGTAVLVLLATAFLVWRLAANVRPRLAA